MILALLLACTAGDKDSAEPAPTVSWLLPEADSTVTAGDIECSIIVENFTLESPALHNEGAPTGHLSLSLDGAEVMQTADTSPTVPVEAGEHTLTASLLYSDGDEVQSDGELLCEEDATDGCAPVEASVSFTAEAG